MFRGPDSTVVAMVLIVAIMVSPIRLTVRIVRIRRHAGITWRFLIADIPSRSTLARMIPSPMAAFPFRLTARFDKVLRAAVTMTTDQFRCSHRAEPPLGQILAASGLTPFAGFRVATLAHPRVSASRAHLSRRVRHATGIRKSRSEARPRDEGCRPRSPRRGIRPTSLP